MEYSHGLMAESMKANGSMGNSMERAITLVLLEKKSKVSGEMEND